jgi:hypothetical protein
VCHGPVIVGERPGEKQALGPIRSRLR